MIHNSSEVLTNNIGDNTNVWQNCVILKGAIIGNNCNINFNVFIENEVDIGDNVTIKPGVQIWDGVTIEDNVFIGPNVTFTNDLLPRSKNLDYALLKTIIRGGASLGANCTIIAGNEIGENAMIGAGAVVTKPVGKNELWVGNPAKKIGYITNEGEVLDLSLASKTTSSQFEWENGHLRKCND